MSSLGTVLESLATIVGKIDSNLAKTHATSYIRIDDDNHNGIVTVNDIFDACGMILHTIFVVQLMRVVSSIVVISKVFGASGNLCMELQLV